MEMPNVVVAYLGVTAMLAALGGNREAADTIAKGLEAAGGDLPSTHMGLAVVDMEAGRLDAAATRLENKVLASNPNHVRAKVFLGLIEHRRGNNGRAEQLWQQATSGGADDKLVASIERERAGS